MNVAYIPARGGSKAIPMKNIKPVAGRPLIYYALKAACECEEIGSVFVSTDSLRIAETALSFGFGKVSVIGRSAESAADTAATERGMLEFAETHNFDNIVLIQATNPLITARDLTEGLNALSEGADSALSAVCQKRFIWRKTNGGRFAEPVNYDVRRRPRRQEFEGFYAENGAFYATGRRALLKSGCRLSGSVKIVEMPPESYFELDEPSDFIIIENILKLRARAAKTENAEIKMFLTDCDGTLTDGGMYYTRGGDCMKKFHTRDGVGLRLLNERGIITGLVSGEASPLAALRAKKLNVCEIHINCAEKKRLMLELCEKYGFGAESVAYIGDDVNDLECVEACGLSACPADAAGAVKNRADYVCASKGGAGAVREFAEYVLNGRNCFL